VGSAGDLGLKRAQNEDRLSVSLPTSPEEQERGALFVVADGMGGALAGEVASQLAVDCVVRHYRESRSGILEGLRESIETANHVIHEHGSTYPELRGMGTTCTALVLRDGEAYVAHVGDSRVYVVRDGAIRQVTRDHSLVAQLVQHRHLTVEQARVDPRRNVVTRSVGVGPEVEVDAERLADPPAVVDAFVHCTDGLHCIVHDDEIARAASSYDVYRACHYLVELARQRGGFDNITVVIAFLAR